MLVWETQVEATRSHHITAARKATANTTRNLSGDEDVEKSGPSHTLVGRLMGLENGLALPQKVKPELPNVYQRETETYAPKDLSTNAPPSRVSLESPRSQNAPQGHPQRHGSTKHRSSLQGAWLAVGKNQHSHVVPPRRTSKPYVREARHKRPYVI